MVVPTRRSVHIFPLLLVHPFHQLQTPIQANELLSQYAEVHNLTTVEKAEFAGFARTGAPGCTSLLHSHLKLSEMADVQDSNRTPTTTASTIHKLTHNHCLPQLSFDSGLPSSPVSFSLTSHSLRATRCNRQTKKHQNDTFLKSSEPHQ